MTLHFSSATLQSYENQNKKMDLFYNPIVIFENITLEQIEKFEDVKWIVSSEKIGTHDLEVLAINLLNFEEENKVFIEFKLRKNDIAFQKNFYSCKINFSAKCEQEKIEYEVLGVVKTKWSKGLI